MKTNTILLFVVLGILFISTLGIRAIPLGNYDTDGSLNVSITNPTSDFNSIITIDTSHNEIHEGKHYYLRGYTSIPASTTYTYLLRTSAKEVHILSEFWSIDGAVNISFHDNVSVSANGTNINYFNSNRNYNDTNSLKVYLNPTITNNGTFLGANYIGVGNKLGGQVRAESELILKPNSIYLFRITNQILQPNIFNYNFGWYDEE